MRKIGVEVQAHRRVSWVKAAPGAAAAISSGDGLNWSPGGPLPQYPERDAVTGSSTHLQHTLVTRVCRDAGARWPPAGHALMSFLDLYEIDHLCETKQTASATKRVRCVLELLDIRHGASNHASQI